MYIDNNAALSMGTANDVTSRSNYIYICCHYFNEQVNEGRLVPIKAPTDQQQADMFTKRVPRNKILRNMQMLRGKGTQV